MFLKLKNVKSEFVRKSKLNKLHVYHRIKTVACFNCDSCDGYFERDLKHMDRKRLNNNYFHCCASCDAKRFAQRKSVERKKIWNLPASTDLPVSKH